MCILFSAYILFISFIMIIYTLKLNALDGLSDYYKNEINHTLKTKEVKI